jgi:hypothetical protein
MLYDTLGFFQKQVHASFDPLMQKIGFITRDSNSKQALINFETLAFIGGISVFQNGIGTSSENLMDEAVVYENGDCILVFSYEIDQPNRLNIGLGAQDKTELLPSGSFCDITSELLDISEQHMFSFSNENELKNILSLLHSGIIEKYLQDLGPKEETILYLHKHYNEKSCAYQAVSDAKNIEDTQSKAAKAFKNKDFACVISLLESIPKENLSDIDKKRLSVAQKKS